MLSELLNLIKNPKLTKVLLSHAHSGYLFENGWIRSYKKGMPVDKSDKPLPWVTYSFIKFITPILNNNMRLFEYGAGNSTLFYSEKVSQVDCVEHDERWYETISSLMPNNVELMLRSLNKESVYASSVKEKQVSYDIIIVDGRMRVDCIFNSYGALSQHGCIVLDDSERVAYEKGIEFLLSKGFKKLDFWGIAPGLFYEKCTTVFYRDANCLNL